MTNSPTMRSQALAHLSALQILWLITAIFALQPLATDLYLPSLPGIALHFGAPVATVQLTLSLYVITFGLSLVAVGPLCDRFGRRKTALIGLCFYIAGSLVCMLAQHIEVLILGRALQALGSCAGLVSSRAMVRDLYAPQDGARMLASAGMLMSFVPLLGPMLGGWLEASLGWRAAFAAHALFALILLVPCVLVLHETAERLDPSATKVRQIAANLLEIGRHPTFLAYALTTSSSYAGLFAFISGSSFVFIKVLQIAPEHYGVLFGLAVSGYLSGATLCRKLLPLLGIERCLRLAAVISSASGLCMLGLAFGGVIHPAAILVPMFCYLLAHGLIVPCAQSGAVAWFPHKAGTATALMGMIQMALASLVGLFIGLSFDGTVFPLVGTIAAGSIAVTLCISFGVARHGRLPSH